jgi:hypothetical protein
MLCVFKHKVLGEEFLINYKVIAERVLILSDKRLGTIARKGQGEASFQFGA